MVFDKAEFEEFENKTDEVLRIIKGMSSSAIDPATVKTFEERAEDELQEQRAALKKRQKKILENRVNTFLKESNKFWELAELFRGITKDNFLKTRSQLNTNPDEAEKQPPTKQQIKMKSAAEKASIDYSPWEEWTASPDDPVSLEEQAILDQKKQQFEMQQFERNNPDFCNGYKEDAKKRNKAARTKLDKVKSNLNKGRRAMSKRQYHTALKLYQDVESLLEPSVLEIIAVTNNIGLLYYKLDFTLTSKEHSDIYLLHEDDELSIEDKLMRCMDYAERVLYFDRYNLKASLRRAKYLSLMNKSVAAFDELSLTLSHVKKEEKDANLLVREMCLLKNKLAGELRDTRLLSALEEKEIASYRAVILNSDSFVGLVKVVELVRKDASGKAAFRRYGGIEMIVHRVSGDGMDSESLKVCLELIFCLVESSEDVFTVEYFISTGFMEKVLNIDLRGSVDIWISLVKQFMEFKVFCEHFRGLLRDEKLQRFYFTLKHNVGKEMATLLVKTLKIQNTYDLRIWNMSFTVQEFLSLYVKPTRKTVSECWSCLQCWIRDGESKEVVLKAPVLFQGVDVSCEVEAFRMLQFLCSLLASDSELETIFLRRFMMEDIFARLAECDVDLGDETTYLLLALFRKCVKKAVDKSQISILFASLRRIWTRTGRSSRFGSVLVGAVYEVLQRFPDNQVLQGIFPEVKCLFVAAEAFCETSDEFLIANTTLLLTVVLDITGEFSRRHDCWIIMLIDCFKKVKMASARKNVGILLAKLSLLSQDNAKLLREHRGYELLASVNPS